MFRKKEKKITKIISINYVLSGGRCGEWLSVAFGAHRRAQFVSECQAHALALGTDSDVAMDRRGVIHRRGLLDGHVAQGIFSKDRVAAEVGSQESTVSFCKQLVQRGGGRE